MIWARRQPWLWKAICVLTLGAFLVASHGMLPSPSFLASYFSGWSGERYPCENCGCGCASATECWTHCCCHTAHERLVWALENGVLPPPVATFSDDQWIGAANAVRAGSAHCALCVGKLKDSLSRGIALVRVSGAEGGAACRVIGVDGRKSTGAESSSCCSGEIRQNGRAAFGLSMSGLACKGVKQLLTVSLPVTFSARVVEIEVPARVCGKVPLPRDAISSTRGLDVPVPPPRVG